MSSRQSLRPVQTFNGSDAIKIASGNTFKPRFLLSVGLILGILSSSVSAQNDEAASISVGESKIIPSARFEYRQVSNAFLTNTDQTEATALVIKPRASWVADRRLLALTGIYEGEYASYSEDVLNYANHSLRAIVDAELSKRSRLRARLAFNFGHQALGTVFTRGTADTNTDQVEFLDTNFSGSYLYGAQSARGNLEVGLGITSRSYQNQANLTDGWGYTNISPFGQFSLRISADTRAIATVRFTNVTYELSSRDRNDISLLAGLSFDATGRTGGQFQLGTSLTNFNLASRTDETSFIAEAELFFEPSVFSRFELTAARVLDNDAGSPLNSSTVLTVTDSAKLNWEHEWSSRLYHVANVSYRLENGDCPTSGTLTQTSGGVELNLVLRRWLHVGASIAGNSRDTTLCPNVESTEGDLSYESQVIGAHIRATL